MSRSSSSMSSNPLNKRGRIASRGHLTTFPKLISRRHVCSIIPFKQVLGSHTFILLTYVTQGSREVRLGNVHIDLDMLFLNLSLQLLDFLFVYFLQKSNLFLQGFHFAFKVKTCRRRIVNILSERLQGALGFLSLKHLLLQFLPEVHDVLGQVVAFHLDAGFVLGELVHLPAQLPHLLLVEVPQARLALALELLELGQQDLILLLQEAHLVDVVCEAVVQLLQLHLLVGAGVLELGVDGVGQREVHRVLQQSHPGHAAPQAHCQGAHGIHAAGDEA
ncbi:uncharacterized protein LOC103791227 [Callithrix jacchus]